MKISNILVATDFSPSAARAVAMAADYARHFQAQLTILHAYRVDIPVASPLTGGGYVLPDGFFEQTPKRRDRGSSRWRAKLPPRQSCHPQYLQSCALVVHK